MDEYTTRIATPQDAKAVDDLLKASCRELMAQAYEEVVLAPVLELITKSNESLLASGTYMSLRLRADQLSAAVGGRSKSPLEQMALQVRLGIYGTSERIPHGSAEE